MQQIAKHFAERLGLDPTQVDLTHVDPISAPKLLIVHDRGDRTIPFAESERLVRAWPMASLFATEGLGHTRILANVGVHERVLEFALT
jgi:hypothetical protein